MSNKHRKLHRMRVAQHDLAWTLFAIARRQGINCAPIRVFLDRTMALAMGDL